MAVARYDEVADFYVAGWGDKCDDPAALALLALAEPIDGARVLDVACGHGRVTRELARRGGLVTGVDISESLLQRAVDADREDRFGIVYQLADITTGVLPVPDPFDLATCNFGLSDVDQLAPALQSIVSVLRPGARFVFSILHPCFPGGGEVSGSWPTGGRYGEERYWTPAGTESSLRRRVGANHRMLSTYINSLIDSGLVIDRLVEPDPGPGWDGARAEAGRHPVYLAIATSLPSALV